MSKIHQHLKYIAADLFVPIMRVTGFRFTKAWRGNKVIEHVYANLKADGIPVEKLIW
jgi:hypothetical protein